MQAIDIVTLSLKALLEPERDGADTDEAMLGTSKCNEGLEVTVNPK